MKICLKRNMDCVKGSITLETAIIFPILIVLIVMLVNFMIGACKTAIQVTSRLSEHTQRWSESAPGKNWSGVQNEIK